MKTIKSLLVLLAILALAPAVYAEDIAKAANTPSTPTTAESPSPATVEAVAPAAAALAMATTSDVYKIDPVHSRIGFIATHMLVSETEGNFNAVDGEIAFDRNKPEAFSAIATIQADSINTSNEGRDNHLKGPDFFDVEKFPTITFVSKTIRNTATGGAEIVGDLTIKGVTKEIVIPVTVLGPVKSPMGGQIIGIKGETKINRQDFGVSWNKPMSEDPAAAADKVVGDEVTLIIKIEAKM